MALHSADAVVDALPYFDLGYDESGVKESAAELVEEETKRYRPTKNYLEHLPDPEYHAFETDIMKAEFDRLQQRLPMEPLSMKRYELPQPPPGKMMDITAWNEAVSNSHAQLEHQRLRIHNLGLMELYGSHMWKAHNDALLRMVNSAQRDLQQVRKEIQDINWQRKSEQTDAGKKLQQLEESWVNLITKNYEIEQSCAKLEKEIEELHRAKASSSAEKGGRKGRKN